MSISGGFKWEASRGRSVEVATMYRDLQHPEIDWIESTGYPSWMQEDEDEGPDYDEDAAYEERRDRERLGIGADEE